MSSGYPFPIKSSFSCIILFKKIKLCCDVSGDYLLFYSWFYMNFPLFHWNIARIPIEIMIFAITFLFWWCTTLVKFGWEVVPQCFLFEWKSMSEKFGREVAPPRFHFQSKSTSHAEVTPLHFFFWTDIRFPRYRRGGRSCHIGLQKESHVLSTYKRQEHTSKTWETCERHVRNMWETCEKHASISGPRLHSSSTLLPFSDGIALHLASVVPDNYQGL